MTLHRYEIETRTVYMPGHTAQCWCGWSGKCRDSYREAVEDYEEHAKDSD